MSLLNRFWSNSILKNLSFLVSGTALAQVIIIVFQIVLRRIFNPSDFGAFAVYMSIVGIIATVSSLRYEQAIILPTDETKAYNLLHLSFAIGLVFSFITLIAIVFFRQPIMVLVNYPEEYANWLMFIPVSLLFLTIYQAYNYYLIRLKFFWLSASNKVERRIAEGVTQTIVGKLGHKIGLVMGDVVGQFVNAVAAGIKVHKNTRELKASVSGMRQVAIDYKAFPLQNSAAAFLNALCLMLPTIFVNRLFDEQTTGIFDLARMILIMPLSLVTTSMGQVLVQNFSEKRNKRESVKGVYLRIITLLGIGALAFATLATIFAPMLIAFIFGEEWRESGLYIQILAWSFLLKFVVSPFNMVFTAFEKIGRLSIWQIIYFVLIISLLLFEFNSVYSFLIALSVVDIISYIIVGLMGLRVVNEYESELKTETKEENQCQNK